MSDLYRDRLKDYLSCGKRLEGYIPGSTYWFRVINSNFCDIWLHLFRRFMLRLFHFDGGSSGWVNYSRQVFNVAQLFYQIGDTTAQYFVQLWAYTIRSSQCGEAERIAEAKTRDKLRVGRMCRLQERWDKVRQGFFLIRWRNTLDHRKPEF